MISPRLLSIVRFSAAVSLAGLLIFLLCVSTGGGQVQAAPLFQGTPDYPGPEQPTYTNGYDAPATSAPPGAEVTPQASPTFGVPLTPTTAGTATMPPTLPPDVFRTEDSEMNNSLTTPPVTETPGPSNTPYVTLTAQKTQLHGTAAAAAARKKPPFVFDWGLFWVGFSLPVLASCGVVLYLLDRRPDLFKKK